MAPDLGVNVARFLSTTAERRADEPAVRVARGVGARTRFEGSSFAQLDERATRIAAGLRALGPRAEGLRPGDRACVFVRPGVELVAITFALFRCGAVPVLIDPGMGRASLLACVERMRPRAFVGIPAAHVARLAFRRAFASVEVLVTVGAPRLWGGASLERLARTAPAGGAIEDTRADSPAAVLFTSGSTGPAKGVQYTHGMFAAQIEALRALYAFEPGEVDAACFPLFALFSPALEMSCVFPAMDVSKPAQCVPARVIDAIREGGATTSFGSPAIWKRVVPWAIERGITLPGLRRILIAGAPVPITLFEDCHKLLEGDADVHTPYGATEALPVSSISGREVLKTARVRTESGFGTCVGGLAPGIEARLIPITDEPLASFDGVEEVADGQPGEVCVSGAVVTREYLFDEAATARAKIRDGARVWHRMGDIAWRGVDGRLWFCGRKSHRLETADGLVLPVPVENVMNVDARVARSALVGVGPRGAERPVLVVETEANRRPASPAEEAMLRDDLLALARRNPKTRVIEEVLFHPSLPVDVRHNAKIRREDLKLWAQEQLA